ncbi:MAG: hypothetical protein KF752_15015 [Pirellulaceae bacterium]|nr:hypothetical protein [Pirellulaceae bacterium]
MARWFRLWGKKRGSRMSGWWVAGRVSEAAFFGTLLLLGIVSLTTVVTWQLFWPESSMFKIGFGFWLMVIASSSFVIIGLTGFTFNVTRTLASPERRNALASQVKRDHQRRSQGIAQVTPGSLPSVKPLTDSPGVKLAYRLADQSDDRLPIVLSALFSVAWNSLVAVLVVIAVQNMVSGTPLWFLNLLILPFGAVSFFSTRWFFRLFRTHAGIGPTAMEISDLPLLPGQGYQLYVCQYGKAEFSKLAIRLVGYEEAIYQQGTDVRTEQVQFASYPAQAVESASTGVRTEGVLRADPEEPLELICQIQVPADIMHSFHGVNHSVRWKIELEGESPQWPEFRRSFPVVVYPHDAR